MTTIHKTLDEHDHSWLQRPPAHRIVVAQLAVSALLFATLLPAGFNVALSALIGGLCSLVPNAYFIWQAFRYTGARSAKLIVRSFFRGEAGKLALTAIAFTLSFILIKPLEPLALFGAFILVQMVYWLAPLLVCRQSKQQKDQYCRHL